MITCCKGCEQRHRACWDSCPEYREQKAADDERRREIQKAENTRYALDGARIVAIKKTKREGRRHK